jgi:hypothetical protein
VVAHDCLAVYPASAANTAAGPDSSAGLDVCGCTDERIRVRPGARADQAAAVRVPVVCSHLAGVVFDGLDASSGFSSHSIPFWRSLDATKE